MTEIVEHGDRASGGEGRVVRVGEHQTVVALKDYKDIYNQITGKTEKIKKRYNDNILVDLSELEQLHHKIMQLCGIHSVIANTESISVFHEKERTEQFTSFDQFRSYNANAPSPTVNVLLKYNFSIIPNGRQRPQEYTVSIRLTSRLGAMKQLEDDDGPGFLFSGFHRYVLAHTAEVTVEYVDYVIARGFLEAFDEWIKGCKCTQKSKLLRHLRQRSYLVPEFVQLGIAAVLTWYAFQGVPASFSAASGPELWAKFFTLYLGSGYILIVLAGKSGSLIERAIDTYPELSYLKLNRGDEKIIEESKKQRPMALLRLFSGIVSAILVAIVSSKIEKLL
ncbi:hypothetical protein [Variovorax sp. CCNWLW235]|uniref:hypothetical protein n=1 Tax=Variovorax sp. CCNWLW235 TaxID=3127463 RepID=UPI003077AD47